jgi:hypothetical protein
MDSSVRGKAHFIGRYRQVIDYSQLLYGKVTPSDIDGIIDFAGKLFVIIELKFSGAPFLYGQRLCLERVCDGLQNQKSDAVLFVATHSVPVEDEVDASVCLVSEYRWHGKWHTPKDRVTLRAAIDMTRKFRNIL